MTNVDLTSRITERLHGFIYLIYIINNVKIFNKLIQVTFDSLSPLSVND